MNKLINPYDLGDFNLEEYISKVDINELVKKADKELKELLLKTEIDILGLKIELTTTRTRFDGRRVWFICPNCGRRSGIVYKPLVGNKVGCRKCLNIKYRKQRYKGMIEEKISR